MDNNCLTWKLVYLCLDLVKCIYIILPGFTALLALFLPCKAPLISAFFCDKGHFALGPGYRCVFIVHEFLNMATLIVAGAHQSCVTLVPCLAYLLTELKRALSFSVGLSDYRKLQVSEKIVNALIHF